MLGSSGTVTTLAGVHLDLPRYNRAHVDGCMLDFAEIDAPRGTAGAHVARSASAIPVSAPTAPIWCISGCAILEAMCRTWPVGRLRVADRGIREGILFDLMHGGEAGG